MVLRIPNIHRNELSFSFECQTKVSMGHYPVKDTKSYTFCYFCCCNISSVPKGNEHLMP